MTKKSSSSPAHPPISSPYAAPIEHSVAESSELVSSLFVQRLRGMKGWIYFLAVLLSIVLTLVILMSLLGFGTLGFPFSSVASVFMSIAAAGVSLLPVLRLFGICRAISQLEASHSEKDLDAVLGSMQSFWKFVSMIAGSITLLWLMRYGLSQFT